MDSYLKSPGQSLQIYILKILLSVFISTLSIKVRVFKKKKKMVALTAGARQKEHGKMAPAPGL